MAKRKTLDQNKSLIHEELPSSEYETENYDAKFVEELVASAKSMGLEEIEARFDSLGIDLVDAACDAAALIYDDDHNIEDQEHKMSNFENTCRAMNVYATSIAPVCGLNMFPLSSLYGSFMWQSCKAIDHLVDGVKNTSMLNNTVKIPDVINSTDIGMYNLDQNITVYIREKEKQSYQEGIDKISKICREQRHQVGSSGIRSINCQISEKIN